MDTAGLWMLATAGALIVGTGLPAWVMLVGVALAFSVAGVAFGVIPRELLYGIPSRLVGLLDNDLLQALPLYVLMGALINRLPLGDLLFRTGRRTLRWTGAGAPLAGLGLGVMLAPMSGSVGASAAMLTRTLLPRLRSAGMRTDRGAALVCVASTLGVVVPPSLVLILLGDAMLRAHTEAVNATGHAVRIINTQDVFRGALVPAAMLLALYALAVWRRNRHLRPVRAQSSGLSLGEALTALSSACLIVGLLAGVTLGYLYAVEAAATGGVVLLGYGVVTRRLKPTVLSAVLADTMAITGALFALLVGATIFTLVVRAFGTDRWVAEWLSGMGGGERAALATVLVLLGACAFVLDAFEMIFVVVPIVMPPLLMRVPDATWVAVLTLLVLQASFLVPPIGYAVLMVRHRVERALPMRRLVRALSPFLIAQAFVLALAFAFPAIVWRGPVPQTPPPARVDPDATYTDDFPSATEVPAAPQEGQAPPPSGK